MIVLKILGIVAAVAGLMLFAWCLTGMSSKLTREEERARVLKPCPVCRRIPHLGYCCGEYFIFGEYPDCPGCGTAFTEMHSSPELEVDAWNRRAEANADT